MREISGRTAARGPAPPARLRQPPADTEPSPPQRKKMTH
jgi:hypothetical protein